MFLLMVGSEPVNMANNVYNPKARVKVKIETVRRPPMRVFACVSPFRLKDGIGAPKLSA